MASWSRASEHLVTLIGMSDQLKWNNQHPILYLTDLLKSEYTYNQPYSKKSSSFSKKSNDRGRKYLSETRIKSSILEVSNEQQREIDKAIEEYNKRMENQLLVKYF